jgi:hypothetical protein
MPGPIDTLAIYQRLKSANLDEAAAKEIADIFNDFIEFRLTTKEDLERTRMALSADITRLETATKADLDKLRMELSAEIATIKADLELSIQKFHADVKVEVEKSSKETIRWVAGMLVAQAAVFVALVTALMKLL